MTERISRREFVVTSTAGLAAAAAAPAFGDPSTSSGQAPVVMTKKSVKPVVISSDNGNHYKNGGSMTCVEKAFSLMMSGTDVLEALIAGVNIVELDPLDTSVGYGGLPNADGVVQLDSCCMHGPLKRAGGVGALEGVRTPSLVAHKVMQETDHHLIVGKGAQDFARSMGFKIEDDLNTETSRKTWLEWKRRTDPLHYLDPIKRDAALRQVELDMIAEGLINSNHFYGTINCDGVNAKGEVCGVTTTSGLAWKIPGRCGDSPILGAGLYVDNEVGAAGSTGRGEANLYNLTSYLVVENMRRGMHPKDAAIDGLKRIKANTVEKRLLKANGDPNFNITFYALSKTGEYAAVSMYAGKDISYAVCTEQGAKTVPCEPFLPGNATD
jgi:N4-(beta-N-acetylglucosaminyl)-L-asparaginase